MLVLLFHLGNESYALDSSQIVEIIPSVNLRQIYQAPAHVAGLFNYRGKLVPVIDLCHLIQGSPCHPCLSTRIIIVNYPIGGDRLQHLGLMAEKVTDTLYQPTTEREAGKDRSKTTTNLGRIIIDEQNMIQLIRIETLLDRQELSRLLLGTGIDSE